jgi:hypothetical protein
MTAGAAWIAFGISAAIFLAYEIRAVWLGRTHPERVARSAHARMRVTWVATLSRQAGFEIVAVQALRNSLMSATIAASTAALALMATVSFAGGAVRGTVLQLGALDALPWLSLHGLQALLEALLMLTLFASYVCSAMAMRYFNHAGFVMSMPVAAPERQPLNALATNYVERAGLLYSWGLRFFLMIAPLVAGIVHPSAMPPLTIVLVIVLAYFDRPAQPGVATTREGS